jgi:anti-sigma B factor antagonist
VLGEEIGMNRQVQSFQAEVRSEENRAVLVMIGEINGLADAAMVAAYEQAQETAPARIMLDFSQVDYINSTGIALVVGLLAKARAAHIPLTAVGLSEHYREIFTITRLSDFIEIE